MKSFACLALGLCAGACGRAAEGAGADSRATLSAQVTFQDAPSDTDGAHLDPVVPMAQRGGLFLTLRGPADIADPCADADTKAFVASYGGAAIIERGELRASLYPTTSPATTTPSGCAATNLEVHGVSDVYLLLELPTNAATCASFCAGHARARGYDTCQNQADQPTCRGTFEPGARATCEQACNQSAAIAGTGQLAQSQLGTIDAQDLQRGALGDIEAVITVDHLVDANRAPVALP